MLPLDSLSSSKTRHAVVVAWACWTASSWRSVSAQPPYNDCDDLIAYYSTLPANVDDWTREAVFNLTRDKHRNIVPKNPSNSNDDSLYDALVDLYPGDNPDGSTVFLRYGNISSSSANPGDPQTWDHDLLWPLSYGIDNTSPAYTDLHMNVPADYTVIQAKLDKLFGRCGLFDNATDCVSPATSETATGTEQDDVVFAPPNATRGDIARSLLYAELRYQQSLGLMLSDCPPFQDTKTYGYLSELLTWHKQDDASLEEKDRNTRACAMWQGNRNPFVDYPELVDKFFGNPDEIVEGTTSYSQCPGVDLPPPTPPEPVPNNCTDMLQPGDVPFFLVNADNPDQVVLFPLATIPPEVGALYVTNNAWNGSSFETNEGTMKFNIPESGVGATVEFGFGPGVPYYERWEQVGGEDFFDVKKSQDQLFVYCLDGADNPHVLFGLSLAGDWITADHGIDYGTSASAVPATLSGVAELNFPPDDNCYYKGPQSGSKEQLMSHFLDYSNWECSSEERYDVTDDQFYENCGFDDYYGNLTNFIESWNMSYMADHLVDMQRELLPVNGETDEDDDVWMAVMDLYPGDFPGETVRLLYRDVVEDVTTDDEGDLWQIDGMWPVPRGVRESSVAYRDVHGNKPADPEMSDNRAGLLFGRCGILADPDECQRPAFEGAADDTERDSEMFSPPVKYRGDVARAVFYIALRYGDEQGLLLKDCPPFESGEFGYLSELLVWHRDDPVSNEEINRNIRACTRWQGNRNPFVDYPQLVEQFFGQPLGTNESTGLYEGCDPLPTQPPTPRANTCTSTLFPGDMYLYVLNSDQPDQIIFFPLSSISDEIGELYVTDNAWTGSELADDEGTLKFTIPEGGLVAGQAFGFGQGSPFSDNWEPVDDAKIFDLGSGGDQVFMYCRDADDKPHFLFGFSYNGDWSSDGLADYGFGTSALPLSLMGRGNVALPHMDNCLYEGPNSGSKSELQAGFTNTENYRCDNDLRFQVSLGGDSSAAVALGAHGRSLPLSLASVIGLIVVVLPGFL